MSLLLALLAPAWAQQAPDADAPSVDEGAAAPAQPPPPAEVEADADEADELSAEDLAAIEAAIAADMEAAAPAPEPQAAPGPAPLASLNPDISFIADIAGAWFSADDPNMGGAHDPNRSGFTLQQLELAVGGAVDPYLRFDSNIVFAQFGVEVEEVYATTLALPWRTQLRAGQFLTRFGRQNPTHPHTWAFVDQPFPVSRVMGGEGNRGLGVEGSVLLPLPWYVELVLSETHIEGESTARTWYQANDVGVNGPLDLQTTAALKQFFPLGDDLSLMTGLSWIGGPNGSGRDNRAELYGVDLYLKYRPISRQSFTEISLHSEWFHRRRQLPSLLLTDWSGFTALSWRVAQRWALAARHELGTPAVDQGGAAGADPLDPAWVGTRQRGAVNATFWPTEFSRLRLQYNADHLPWTESPVDHGVMLAFEFNVGAHGAHSF